MCPGWAARSGWWRSTRRGRNEVNQAVAAARDRAQRGFAGIKVPGSSRAAHVAAPDGRPSAGRHRLLTGSHRPSRHQPLHSFVWSDTDGITQKV
jgi:hypothetical protein